MRSDKIIFSKEEIDTIINMYCVQEKSMRNIGLHFNCSNHTIKRVLISHSIVIKNNHDVGRVKFSEEDKLDILNKYNSKVPVYKIADEYHYSDGTIRALLKRCGIIFNNSREPVLSLEQLKSKKYGTLSILEETSTDYANRKMLCKCDCGNEKIICLSSLRMGETITCGDYTKHDRKGKNCKTFTGYETITGSIVNRFRKGAKVRNIEFNITAKYLYELFMQQNGCCALSGIKLILPNGSKECNKGTASLDRIDSSKGYIEGNLQWIYKPLNCMKYTLKQEEFIEYCRIITNFQNSK